VTSRSLAGLRRRALVVIALVVASSAPAAAGPPRTRAIDFATDDPGGELGERYTAPPPDQKHPPLTPDRYRGIPGPAAEGPIDDPLATHAIPASERPFWLGVRLGGGMFDDSAAAARAGVAFGLAGRVRMSERMFAAVRADWSRRGGEVMTAGAASAAAIDVIGASAGLGVTIAGARTGAPVALIGQLRADLRLADTRATAAVHRTGLGVALGAELALPATPFTAGLRFEQGVTELVPGARDRAVLVELGVDLR
jgi:hypothetical protein